MTAILVLEIDGKMLRAAVLRRRFRGYTVTDCLRLDRTEEGDLPTAAELATVTSRIANCPKSVAVVSPLAMVIELTMDRSRLKKMRPEQLKEALRWEAEPYTAIPAAESLAGYDIGAETVEGQVEVRVAVMPAEDYRSLKRLLAEKGLRLKKVYPPEACFPLAGMLTGEDEGLFIDIGQETMRFALVSDGDVTAYRSLPVGLAAARAHVDGLPAPELEPGLAEVFRAWGLGDRKVIITGRGALDGDIVRFFGERFGADALGLEAAGAPVPDFAAALGTGVRELSLSGRRRLAGIDDRVPLTKLVRERVHILPLAAVLLVLAVFGGHYFYLKSQLRHCEEEIAVLKTEKARHEQAMAAYNSLKSEADSLEKHAAALSARLSFLQNLPRSQELNLQALLEVLAYETAPDLSLKEFKPEGDSLYLVAGESESLESINRLVLTLQSKIWCVYAKPEIITKGTVTEKFTEKVMTEEGEEEVTTEFEREVYNFKLKVRLGNVSV